jgi:hypothetical protein
MTYAYADAHGLRVEDPIHGHAILSAEGEGGYLDRLARNSVNIEAAADEILTERGHTRVGQWEIVIDDGLRYVPDIPAYRAEVQ